MRMISEDRKEVAVTQVNRPLDDGARRPPNVTLTEALLADANARGINVSRACEHGLIDEVRNETARRWQESNAAGFEAWNLHVEHHGLPLAQYRKF
jgi:antitoxin CcdA